jgi:hypothetical protein
MVVESWTWAFACLHQTGDQSSVIYPVDCIIACTERGFDVSKLAWGPCTFRDKLVMDIWTEERSFPRGYGKCFKILMEQLSLISGIEDELRKFKGTGSGCGRSFAQ